MKNNLTGGTGFLGLLTIVFITLRLIEIIDWSWMWVLAPIWIPIGVFIVGFVIFIAVAVIITVIKEMRRRS